MYIYTIYITFIYLFITSVQFMKHVSCKQKILFFGTASLRFCCGSLRSNAQSLRQAPTVAMNGRRMLDVIAGYLNRRMFGYVFCCRVQP